jgi:coenzyme PQQ precursor peptide PqqA
MIWDKIDRSTPEEGSNNSKTSQANPGESSACPPIGKPLTDWEQPDFDELDLCMEVTTYIHHWQ